MDYALDHEIDLTQKYLLIKVLVFRLLKIIDITGRAITTLIPAQQQEKGEYKLEWLTNIQQAGVYFLQLSIGRKWINEKLVSVD